MDEIAFIQQGLRNHFSDGLVIFDDQHLCCHTSPLLPADRGIEDFSLLYHRARRDGAIALDTSPAGQGGRPDPSNVQFCWSRSSSCWSRSSSCWPRRASSNVCSCAC